MHSVTPLLAYCAQSGLHVCGIVFSASSLCLVSLAAHLHALALTCRRASAWGGMVLQTPMLATPIRQLRRYVTSADVTDQCFDRLGSMVIGLGQAVDGLIELTGFNPCFCVHEAHLRRAASVPDASWICPHYVNVCHVSGTRAYWVTC